MIHLPHVACGTGELILFLDFDGVLHSDWDRPPVPFSQLSLLEQVLREHLHVNVVLSTSWRETDPLDALREPFSEDIRARVIGATPVLNPITRARYPHPLSKAERQSECEAWLVEHRTPAQAPAMKPCLLTERQARATPQPPRCRATTCRLTTLRSTVPVPGKPVDPAPGHRSIARAQQTQEQEQEQTLL